MSRPSKFSDDKILDRACDLFWKTGSPSIREIEDAVELKATAIYRRFGSKDGLQEQCVRRYTERVVRPRLDEILRRSRDPLVGLRNFFDLMIEPHAGESLRRGCLLTNTAALPDRSAGVTQALSVGFDEIETAFRTELVRARQNGSLSARADPDALTNLLFVALQGVLTMARADVTNLKARIDAIFESLRHAAVQ